MPIDRSLLKQTRIGPAVCLVAGAGWLAGGCGNSSSTASPAGAAGDAAANGGSSLAAAASGGSSAAGAGTGGSAPAVAASGGWSAAGVGTGGASVPSAGGHQNVGGTATGGAGVGGAPLGGTSAGGQGCAPPASSARSHPGNFDNQTCNNCHTDLLGGWLYSNAAGDQWIGDATVTITNGDGTTVTAVTASDGFFLLEGEIAGAFTPCVSKCQDSYCAAELHSSPDCQNSACHGGPNQRIFLPQQTEEPQNTGGTDAGGEDCEPPASGGPRTHTAAEYDTVACQICHDLAYTGGFLYDGVNSTTTVAQATVTLTPASGAPPLTAVTGPDGMFYFEGTVPAPYSVCVSKCPDTVCSEASTHSTSADCRTCHDENHKIHLP